MLLGLVSNPGLLAIAGLITTIGLSINGCSNSKKPVSRERIRLSSLEVWVVENAKV